MISAQPAYFHSHVGAVYTTKFMHKNKEGGLWLPAQMEQVNVRCWFANFGGMLQY